MSDPSYSPTPLELPLAVRRCAERLVATGQLPALACQILQRAQSSEVLCLGSETLDGSVPVTTDTRFLVASLTKPMIAMAILQLCERGLLSLNERVVDHLPEFSEAAKRSVTIRHLLTHTSGLPDMLPDNRELRERQSPLSAFVDGACRVPLEFPPGRGVQYQSMGYALLGEIISRVSGVACRDYLRREIFEPLEMHHTSLGADADNLAHIAEIRVPEEQQGGDCWNWNSTYWKTLGSPWGGVIAPAGDLTRFLRCMLRVGQGPHGQVFSPTAAKLATENRLVDFPALSPEDLRTRGWGSGWRLNWADHRSTFSDLLPANAYGHWGATGTLFWVNPYSGTAAVMLTTQPIERNASPLTLLSNVIAANLT